MDGGAFVDPLERYGYFLTISKKSGLNVPEDILREMIRRVDDEIRSMRLIEMSAADCQRNGIRAGFVQGRIGGIFSALLVLRNGSVFRHNPEGRPGPDSTDDEMKSFCKDVFSGSYAAEGCVDPSSWPESVSHFRSCLNTTNSFSKASFSTSRSIGFDLEVIVSSCLGKDMYAPRPKEQVIFEMLMNRAFSSAARRRAGWQAKRIRSALNRDTLRCLNKVMFSTMHTYEAVENCVGHHQKYGTSNPYSSFSSLLETVPCHQFTKEGFLAAKEWDEDPSRMIVKSRRIQALEAYPVFAGVMLHQMMDRDDADIVMAIDEAKELAPVLAEASCSTVAQVRETARISPQVSGIHPYPSDAEVAQILVVKAAGPGKHPKNRKEWKLARSLLHGNLIGNPSRLIFNVRGTWADQVRWAPKIVHCQDFRQDVEHRLVHMCRLSGERLIRQASLFDDIFRNFMDSDRWTIRDNAEMNTLWHRELAARRNFIKSFYPEETSGDELPWEPLVGTFHAKNGLIAEEVTSESALDEIGEDQDHCVGGYAGSVLEGHCVIFRIADEKGKTLSTISVEIGEARPYISQNFARGNTAPSAEALSAGSDILRRVTEIWGAAEKQEEYLENLSVVMEKWKTSNSVLSGGGGLVGDEAFHRAFWNRFHGRYMRRGARGLSFDEAMDRLSIAIKKGKDAQ